MNDLSSQPARTFRWCALFATVLGCFPIILSRPSSPRSHIRTHSQPPSPVRLHVFVNIDLQTWLDRPFEEQNKDPVGNPVQGVLF